MTIGMKDPTYLLPCSRQAVSLAEDFRGALWAEGSILSRVHSYLCLGTAERGNGFWYLLPLPSDHPKGASWQPLMPAPGRQREGTPLLADLGGDALLLAPCQNFTVRKSDKKM